MLIDDFEMELIEMGINTKSGFQIMKRVPPTLTSLLIHVLLSLSIIVEFPSPRPCFHECILLNSPFLPTTTSSNLMRFISFLTHVASVFLLSKTNISSLSPFLSILLSSHRNILIKGASEINQINNHGKRI